MGKSRKTTGRRRAAKPADAGGGHGHLEDDRVSLSEPDGVLTVRDPGLFGPGHEAFCRRLAQAAASKEGVQAVHVGLASGACRVEFAPGQVAAAEMARRFADSVHEAIALGRDPHAADAVDAHEWTALAVFPAGELTSSWETIREGRGELQLRNPILRKDLVLARRVARELSGVSGIAACRAGFWGRDLEIRFDPEATSAVPLISAAEAALRRALRPALDQATVAISDDGNGAGKPLVATGLRRGYYLAMAAGSFMLTVVGLIVPGIPTVPFLLATSYYLVRSSPSLNRTLLQSPFLGPILADLESEGGLRRINKFRLVGLTAAVSLVTFVLIGPSVLVVFVMAAVAAASLYAIARMPELQSSPSPSVA